ncbi:MAG: c-type cytochrome [Thermomicrobiales bacterium]
MRRASPWRLATLVAIGLIVVVAAGWFAMGPLTGGDPTAGPAPLPTLDSDQVVLGRQIYLQNCAACHGASAEGVPNWQQPDARGNLPPPPHDDSGHTWRHGDAELREIIRDGLRDVFNKTPELTMPPFKERLSDEEIAAVIAYVKSLWSPEHRRYQEEQNQRPPMGTPEAAQ